MIDLAGKRSNIRGANCKQMAASSTVLLLILNVEVAKGIDERKKKKYVLNMIVRREGIRRALR